MANKTVDVPVGQFMSDTSLQARLRVTGVRALTIRLWIAQRLIVLAALIVGCSGVDVEFRTSER